VDVGVLLSIPLESVAVRAVLASLLAVALARVLLRGGLRTPPARVATALVPAAVLTLVLLWSMSTPRLPLLMLPAEGVRALPIPVPDGYLHFAPMAVPLLAGLWGAVALWRVVTRVRGHRRVLAAARRAVAEGVVDVRLRRIADDVADALRVPHPRLGTVPRCPGGAYVMGRRHPVVVVGLDLLATLDDDELRGVLAHELAHVRRRDTLLASTIGLLRDLTFFVPGSGWAIRELHRERELAADQLAVRVTGRPGALASGLLKVLEGSPDQQQACAALAPSTNLVDRVRMLVDESPGPSPRRRRLESTAVVAVVIATTATALVVPGLLAGADRERDAVAVVWSSTRPAPEGIVLGAVPGAEPRVFDVYRRADLAVAAPVGTARPGGRELSQENRRAAIHACADQQAICPVPKRAPTLGLRPIVVTVDDSVTARWQATALAGSDADTGLRMFWLARDGD